MIIYLQHMDVASDFDSKMIDLLLTTINDSPHFHETKLFLLHEHFDQLSIEQLDRVLDIYLEVLLD